MKHYRRKKISSDSGSDAPPIGLIMNLSLFIMLLAFFIVLNSTSSLDKEKSDPIVRNITDTFSFSPDEAIEGVVPADGSGDDDELSGLLYEGSSIDRIDVLFERQMSDFKSRKDSASGELRITASFDIFARNVMAVGQYDLFATMEILPERKFFTPTLVSIMKREMAEGTGYRMDMMINVPRSPATMLKERPEEMKKIIQRAIVIARHLEDKGMPEGVIRVGVKKGSAGTVDLFFRKVESFRPVRKEKKGEGE